MTDCRRDDEKTGSEGVSSSLYALENRQMGRWMSKGICAVH
jgi:hypothetical protein